jgi:hypothetical protein
MVTVMVSLRGLMRFSLAIVSDGGVGSGVVVANARFRLGRGWWK